LSLESHQKTAKEKPSSSGRLLRFVEYQGGWCIVILALVVYGNALPNGFTYDDLPVIVENPATNPESSWWAPWCETWWYVHQHKDGAERPYRPFPLQLFALERRLFGLNPLPFHLINVLLHAAVSAGVWWLACRTGSSTSAALLGGVVFAIHPIHVEAVANIVGRAELLSTGGILLALWLFDKRLNLTTKANYSTMRLWLLRIAVLLGAWVALTSKENGLAVVLIIGAWQVWFEYSRRRQVCSDHSESVSFPWFSWVKPVLPLLVLVGLYALLRWQVSGYAILPVGHRIGDGNALIDAGLSERILTPVSLLGRYAGLMIWPERLLCDYSLGVIKLTTSPAEGYFLLGLVVGISLLAISILSARKNCVWLLVIFGFVATYVVVSNSFILIGAIFGERWFYSPSVWLCVALGLMVDRVKVFLAQHQRILRVPLVAGVLVVMLLWLGSRTLLRNPVWESNEILILHDLAIMHPQRRSAHLCSLASRLYSEEGEFDKAESLAQEAVNIYPDSSGYHQLLGRVCLTTGKYEHAIASLSVANQLEPNNAINHLLLENARNLAKGVDLAAELAAARKVAMSNKPSDTEAVRQWAAIAIRVNFEEATVAYRKLLEIDAEDQQAWAGLGDALRGCGRTVQAVETFEKIISRWPNNWGAHSNLSILLMNMNDRDCYSPEKAVLHARRAVEINPDYLPLQENLAEILGCCGYPAEAAELFDDLAAQNLSDSERNRLYRQRARLLREQ